MSQEYNENNIQGLSAREHVRKLPKLYFEQCFQEGNLDALPLEIACHAIDEVLDQNCTLIDITLFEHHFSIQYNAGMSLERSHGEYKAALIMTAVFACSNEKKHLSVGDEFCELGMATINFVAKDCKLTTVFNNQKGIFHFEEGLLITQEIIEVENEEAFTEIILQPDATAFPNLNINFEGLKKRVDQLQKKLDNKVAIKLRKVDD